MLVGVDDSIAVARESASLANELIKSAILSLSKLMLLVGSLCKVSMSCVI